MCVGKKPSKAQAYLESPTDVKLLLEDFMHISLKGRLFNSTLDLRTLGLSDSTVELSLSSEKYHNDFISSNFDLQ